MNDASLKSCCAFAIFALSLPFEAGAHHSTQMFDAENPLELSGTVIEWQWTNPHTFIILEVTGEQGATETWELEGSNTRVMLRRGWTPSTLRPGEEIVVTVRPLKSGATGGNFSDVRRADGEPVGAETE